MFVELRMTDYFERTLDFPVGSNFSFAVFLSGRAASDDAQVCHRELSVSIGLPGATELAKGTLWCRSDGRLDRVVHHVLLSDSGANTYQLRQLARALDLLATLLDAWESLSKCTSFEALYRLQREEAAKE